MVLPVPGGPHSSSDIGASLSMSLRNGVPAASQVLLADDFVQVARAHPHREGRRRGGRLRLRVIEQAAGLGRLASIGSGHTLTVTDPRTKSLHRGEFP